ncbi:MAG: response regulator [Lachnospiraceae bacterium]|nr:response regulator [Lachnospiraceae bacterium]
MGKKILIVDDDAMNRKLAGMMLKKGQHEVEVVESGDAGLEMLRGNMFDVLLLDVEMPEKSGIETLGQIRSEGLGEGMKVLFLTGNEESEVSDAIRKLRADGYIKKPFKPQELLAAVE